MNNFADILSEDILVPMRDGTRLAASILRPGAPGRYPAIISYTPYRRKLVAIAHEKFMAGHGYAVVSFDIRGTGDSSGWNDSIYSAAERQDGYDMVEWAASQPWCNGNVGAWGISFGAVAALQLAMAAPPHLKAIIARSGSDDPYTEWTSPGGQPRLYMYQCYAAIMGARNFSPPGSELWGRDWEAVWQERLQRNVPWGVSFANNLADSAFWRERSLRGKYGQVKCAAYLVGGWSDWYYTPLLRIFSKLSSPRKALIGPWSHLWPDQAIPGPQIDWPAELLRWWGHWLKGEDTGIMDEAPLTIFVNRHNVPANIRNLDNGFFRCENEWPPARAELEELRLTAGNGLVAAAAAGDGGPAAALDVRYDPRVGVASGLFGGGPFNVNWVRPADQRVDELHSLSFTGAPLPEAREITGRPTVRLYVSSTAPVSMLAVKLCDVAPDGSSALLTRGYLNLTHRDGSRCPEPVQPGKIYEIGIEMLACACCIPAGHRLRLNVACADLLNLWPTPYACVNTIHLGAGRPSALFLPMVASRFPALPPPGIRELPQQVDYATLEEPSVRVFQDLVNGTAGFSYGNDSLQNYSSMEVSARNPAAAVCKSEGVFASHVSGSEVICRARCLTESDAASFSHTTEVTVTRGGREFFQKKWHTSTPRETF